MEGRNGRQKGSGSKSPAVRMHPYRREPKVPSYSAHDIVEEPQKASWKRQGSPSSDCSDDPLLLDSDGSNCEWLQIIPIRPPKQSASIPSPDAPVTPPAEEFIIPPAEAPASPPSPRPARSIATSPSCSEAGFAAPAPIHASFNEADDVLENLPEDWYGWTPDSEEHINVAAAMVVCRLFFTPREVAKQRLPSTPEDKLLKRRIEQEVVVPWLKKKQAASHLMPPRRRVSEPLTIICNGYSWESDDVVQTRRPERHMRLTAWEIINYGERNKEQGCWYHRYRCALPDQPEVKDNGSEYDYMLLFMKPMTVPEIWELWIRGRHEEQRRRKHPDWFWSGGFKTDKDRRRAWRRWKSGKAAVRPKKAGWAYSSNGTRQAVEVGPAPSRSPSPDPVLFQPRIMFDIILPPECREAAPERVHPPPLRPSNPPRHRLEAPVGPPSPPPSPAPAAEFSDPAPYPPADSARPARSPSLELEYLTPPPEQVPEAAALQKDIPVLSINTDAARRPDASRTPPSPVSPSSPRGYRTPGPWPDADVQEHIIPADVDDVRVGCEGGLRVGEGAVERVVEGSVGE
ncbi:hypothetical protein EWM64_g4220 [Hericium alpestre]|uniref:Uncharacterized protein n=1 Tax=Hericium alpestre TaxID=135208 RepID=A0A4Z0A0R5_9AGAM|nr:hypothetical protein EWM64_g4220 [Hericium alpestre]